MLGKYEQRFNKYQQTLKINPDDPIAIYRIGKIYLKKGEIDHAEKAFRKVISLYPNFFEALITLARIHQQKGQFQKTIQLYQKALLIKPNSASLYNNLGNIHSNLGDMKQALKCYRRAIVINPNLYLSYFNMANILKISRQFDEAILAYRQAIRYKPDFFQAMNEIGNIHRIMGNQAAAFSAYNDAILANNRFVAPYRYISIMRKFSVKDKYISKMESLLNCSDLSQAEKIMLNFSLGKAYEDLKQYDLAFEYLKEGNRQKRGTINYNKSEYNRIFVKIKEIFSATFLKERSGWGFDDSTPIFIIGMPRSGTSLVEQILATHSDVYGAGELSTLNKIISTYGRKMMKSFFPYSVEKFLQADVKNIGEAYIKRIREFEPEIKFITDKMPQNFLFVGVIRLVLPKARIIHCVRNPMDNCFSIYKNLFSNSHKYAYDLSEIEHYYNLYRDIMRHWHEIIPGFIYDLHYEKLVLKSEKQIKKLLKYCGLDWDERCLFFNKTTRPVLTASTAQVRKPLYKDSIDLWRKYEKKLNNFFIITRNNGNE